MGRSSRSTSPSSRRGTGLPLPAAESSAFSDEHGAVLAARRWSGWEEDVAVEDRGRRIVYYYLRRAPPRGGDGGTAERELAIVGALCHSGRMAYVVHESFLRSLQAAADDRENAPSSRLVAAAEESATLRWKSRKEVMDWLTSLVSDSPYESSMIDDGSDEHPSGDHDDRSSTLSGNNSEAFAWIGPPIPHLDKRRKHYRSFCREGVTISVHDFVHIKTKGTHRHVGYVEDMYEDNDDEIVLIRWFNTDSEYGNVLPSGAHDREILFSHALQDFRAEWVDGVAAVLNAQHFEQFHNTVKDSNWQPYLCNRHIVDDVAQPYDITELQGYPNQKILRTLIDSSSSMELCIKAPQENKPSSSDVGQKRKREAISVQASKNHDLCDAITSPTIANHTPRNAINDQISKTHAPHDEINDPTSKTHAHCNVITAKNLVNPPPASPTKVQTTEGQARRKAIAGKTIEIPTPRNATKARTAQKRLLHDAIKDIQMVEKHLPSTGSSSASGSGLIKNVSNPTMDHLFKPGCHVEVLSQDSSTRGCWFRCLIIKRTDDLIKVVFQDIQNAEKTGHLKEWLRLSRIANPDKLGIRISGRLRIRPQHPQRGVLPSTVAAGSIVDAWWHDGWWEGIVMQQETVGRIRVYFPGESRVAEFHKSDLRRSFEWVDNRWMPLTAGKGILCRLSSIDQVNLAKPNENPSSQKAGLQFNMGGEGSSRPAGQKASLQASKGDEKTYKPMAPKSPMKSILKAVRSPAKPAAQKPSPQYGGSSKPAVQMPSPQYSVPAKPAEQKPILEPRTKGDEGSSKLYPHKISHHSSFVDFKLHCSKGPQEPASPAAGKAIMESSDKSSGIPLDEEMKPFRKRRLVKLRNLTKELKSDKYLKWAERKVRGYSGPTEPSDNTSNQEGVSGDIVPMNSVPDK